MQTMHPRRHSACYPSLKGKVIFITGGGSGIGAALVQRFSWQGAKVAFVDIEKALSEAVVTSLSEHVHPPVFIECDIRDIAALQMAIERVGRDLGEVSVLVNNAANDTRHKIEDVTVEYWDNRMAINQRPMFFAAQAVIPQMKRLGGGSIINFGSVSTRIGSNFPAYMTAKAGAHGLTKGLARDLGPFNIRVNTLVPGWVMTERQRREHLTPEGEARIDALQAIPTRIQPDDIAAMALFLAADDSALCTSQEFIVDGGWI
ncbi:SDR family oxidoreductase [Mesorhizobium muleiense]|uniref:SDR family NAD(P)-dependent oxidoreductase n=1 Tax=Mesorhizobium muleiense TaxID=1004279 RepID=UPI002E334DC9|nr:SDR family oxidoreductase [Mesorhizobium muleiense]